jgi:hypothetical protein
LRDRGQADEDAVRVVAERIALEVDALMDQGTKAEGMKEEADGGS